MYYRRYKLIPHLGFIIIFILYTLFQTHLPSNYVGTNSVANMYAPGRRKCDI